MARSSESKQSHKSKKSEFPFLLLPAELRLKIYNYVCDNKVISLPSPRRAASTIGFANAFTLASLNQQIRSEALPLMFSIPTLIIDCDTLCSHVFVNFPKLAARTVTSVRIVNFDVFNNLEERRMVDYSYTLPLTVFFRSLRYLRVVLSAGQCISKGVTSEDPWYWGHNNFTTDDILASPSIHWIARSRGLEKFTLEAFDLCYDCTKYIDAHRVLGEVAQLLKNGIEQPLDGIRKRSRPGKRFP